MIRFRFAFVFCIFALSIVPSIQAQTGQALKAIFKQAQVGELDWPQWGGSSSRNNTPNGENIPTVWDVGSGENILWKANSGTDSFGNTVVANGRVYVGTNNAGYSKHYGPKVDLGCVVCFSEKDGSVLWQHSNEKLASGDINDNANSGVCSSPCIEGNRGWYVSNRCEVVCFDVEGFRDGEDDGDVKDGATYDEAIREMEGDVVWKLDMIGQLGVFPNQMANCSVTIAGDVVIVCTSNGTDMNNGDVPSPKAPSLIGVNKLTGKVLWTEVAAGANTLEGQWSSPSSAVVQGQPMIIFAAGDGWVYAYDAKSVAGKLNLLWKFDGNPKSWIYKSAGRGDRNYIIGTPVIYKDRVYVGMGQEPSGGEGASTFWCIDATKRGDISPDLVEFGTKAGGGKVDRRFQAAIESVGDVVKPNPNSGLVWKFDEQDVNKDGKIDFDEEYHRSVGTAVIKDDLLYVSDGSGQFFCLDANTGERNWIYDMLSPAWGSALIVDGHVYVGDEDGDLSVFAHSADPEKAMDGGSPWQEIYMEGPMLSTPVSANNRLYLLTADTLFAIEKK